MNYIYFYIRSTPFVVYFFLFLFPSTPIFSQKIQRQQSIGGNQINYTDIEPIEMVGNNYFLPDYISGAYLNAVASGQYGRYRALISRMHLVSARDFLFKESLEKQA